MQNIIRYFFLNFLVAVLLSPVCHASGEQSALWQADTLFAQRKYVEALAIYESIYAQSQYASPGMLKKMAYIHEGLGNYTQALYYLNLNYLYAPQNEALIQMERLAQQHRLKGYDHSDLDFIKALYHRYFLYISTLLLLICTLAFLIMVYRRMKSREVPLRYKLTIFSILLLFFLLISFTDEQPGGLSGRTIPT
ncbi:MAG: hypothetical protein HC880_07505 [Bacteroidia bacterium]|nr:hypothetical protein [Bacteroidia bacterium]